jgi:hypothetical protein
MNFWSLVLGASLGFGAWDLDLCKTDFLLFMALLTEVGTLSARGTKPDIFIFRRCGLEAAIERRVHPCEYLVLRPGD